VQNFVENGKKSSPKNETPLKLTLYGQKHKKLDSTYFAHNFFIKIICRFSLND